MDTSETYIKMCEKAEEIQKGWQPSVGDWFLHDYHGTTRFGELEDTFWPDKEQWERIECLTYKPSIGDYIEVSQPDGRHNVYVTSSLLKDRHIWLPRQDQLQEMVLGKVTKQFDFVSDLQALCFNFREWSQKDDADSWIDFRNEFTSMEQLWLAFVMKEKYGKVWDGSEWIQE